MDANKLNRIMTIFRISLAVIGVLACLLVISGPNMESTKEAREAFRDGGSMAFAINYTIFIIVATSLAILIFFGLQLVSNTKKTLMSIAGVLAALVIYLLFSLIGTSDTAATLQLDESMIGEISDSTIGSTAAGLYTVIVGVIIGAMAWLLGPVIGRFKK